MKRFCPFHVAFPAIGLVACNSDEGLKVYNANPSTQIVSPDDGELVAQNSTIVLRGVASDPNHTSQQLVTRWVANNVTVCDSITPDSMGFSLCEIDVADDDLNIVFEAQDPNNAIGWSSIELAIAPSLPPSAIISSPITGDVYYSDQPILFTGTISDQEDAPTDLQFTWHSDVDGQVLVGATVDGQGGVTGYDNLSQGEHIIRLSVTDTSGKNAFIESPIFVGPPNSPPDCSILSPAELQVFSLNDLVLFTAQSTDVDIPNDAIFIEWESDKDGVIGTSSPDSNGSISFGYSDLSADFHTITMTATDEQEQRCSDSVVIYISAPPVVQIVSPSNGEVINEGENVLLTGVVSDNEDDVHDLQVYWTSNMDGELDVAYPDSFGHVDFISSQLSRGLHDISLIAYDSDGLMGSATISITINGLPSQPTADISPDPAYTLDDLGIQTGQAFDPDGQVVTFQYQWLQDGVSTTHTSGTVPSAVTAKHETWTAIVTPFDGYGYGPAVQTEIIIQNTPPSISSVVISPSTGVVVNSALTCSSSIIDPDETPSHHSTWSNETTGQVLLSNDTIDLSLFSVSKGDVIRCTVQAVDGDGEATSSFTEVVIENTPPIIDSVLLSPSNVTTNELLYVLANATDNDGDSISFDYTWYVDGVSISPQGSSLDGETWFDKGQTVFVRVVPNDGSVDGNPMDSNTVLVDNTPPTAPTIEIAPAEPVAGDDDLICSLVSPAVDADGDSISYEYAWFVDGVATSHMTDTITGSLTDSFENWQCVVTPNDGLVDGSPATTSVTVMDSCDGTTNFTQDDYSAGREVQGARIADVDQDGYLDLLFNEQMDNTLRIYWGDGTGTFSNSAATLVLIGRSGAAGAVGDINNDGHNDLLYSNQDNNRMVLVLGTGNRGFGSQMYITQNSFPQQTTLVDVNLDGNLDALISLGHANCITKWLGNGDGTFNTSGCLLSGSGPTTAGDIDGDGLIEVFHATGGGLSLHDLDAQGELFQTSSFPIAPLQSSGHPHLVDSDLDGDLDLVMSSHAGGVGTLVEWFNDGQGGFIGCEIATGLSRGAFGVGDVNQDQLVDFAAWTSCSGCSSTVHVFLQDP